LPLLVKVKHEQRPRSMNDTASNSSQAFTVTTPLYLHFLTTKYRRKSLLHLVQRTSVAAAAGKMASRAAHPDPAAATDVQPAWERTEPTTNAPRGRN
jgi:hypothetical protein